MKLTPCSDRQCPSRKTCRRYTTSSLSCATFGRVNGEDSCPGFIEVFPKKKMLKEKNCEGFDLMP